MKSIFRPFFSAQKEVIRYQKTRYTEEKIAFVLKQAETGIQIRALTIVGNFSREYLVIEISQGLRGDDVIAAMDRLKQSQGRVPQRLQTNSDRKFIS